MDQKSGKTRPRDAKSDKHSKNACARFLSQTSLIFGLLLIFGMSTCTFCATVLFLGLCIGTACVACTLSTDGKNVPS